MRPAGRDCRFNCQEASAISTNFRHNHQIRISPIFLIDQNDEKLGSTSTSDALKKAQEAGMDLVEVAPNARPPVCKIMDYGKWRYQQQKKEDKSRASAKAGRLKMLNIDTIRIGSHDLEIKINHAREFLKEGNKVQFTLRFKGRELAHIDLGRDLMNKVKHELWPVSKIERDAKMEGKRMTLVLMPDHKQAGAKPPALAGKAPPEGRPAPFMAGSGLNIPARPGMPGPGGLRPGAPAGAPGSLGAPRPGLPVGAPGTTGVARPGMPGAPAGAPSLAPRPPMGGAPAGPAAPLSPPRPAPAAPAGGPTRPPTSAPASVPPRPVGAPQR